VEARILPATVAEDRHGPLDRSCRMASVTSAPTSSARRTGSDRSRRTAIGGVRVDPRVVVDHVVGPLAPHLGSSRVHDSALKFAKMCCTNVVPPVFITCMKRLGFGRSCPAHYPGGVGYVGIGAFEAAHPSTGALLDHLVPTAQADRRRRRAMANIPRRWGDPNGRSNRRARGGALRPDGCAGTSQRVAGLVIRRALRRLLSWTHEENPLG
jgi:hypothetical protein